MGAGAVAMKIGNVDQALRERIAELERLNAELRQQNSELLSQIEWHPSAATTNAAVVPPIALKL